MALVLDPQKVKTKAISQPIEDTDGTRFFVVRKTCNIGRGYFQWLPCLAPSLKLLSQWKSHKITWNKFAQEYKQEIAANIETQKKIRELQSLVEQGETITLLCFEAEFQNCHRHILRDLILQSESKEADSHFNMSAIAILSFIPLQKNQKKQAKLELQLDEVTANPPKCYYCDINKFTNRYEYQKHVLNKHPSKLCYPGQIELKLLSLQSQNMPWEI